MHTIQDQTVVVDGLDDRSTLNVHVKYTKKLHIKVRLAYSILFIAAWIATKILGCGLDVGMEREG